MSLRVVIGTVRAFAGVQFGAQETSTAQYMKHWHPELRL